MIYHAVVIVRLREEGVHRAAVGAGQLGVPEARELSAFVFGSHVLCVFFLCVSFLPCS